MSDDSDDIQKSIEIGNSLKDGQEIRIYDGSTFLKFPKETIQRSGNQIRIYDGMPSIFNPIPKKTIVIGDSTDSSHCFVATEIYQNSDADEVNLYRQFRDEYLKKNALGRSFVNWYYDRGGVEMSSLIRSYPILRAPVKKVLDLGALIIEKLNK